MSAESDASDKSEQALYLLKDNFMNCEALTEGNYCG